MRTTQQNLGGPILDLNRLLPIKLQTYPKAQKFIAQALLRPNYTLPPRVTLRFEHEDRIPEHPVMFAMNHTDRYNYWPFQYHRYRCHNRFTATWVKGKYYESKFVGWFMELTNNIPTVSRGYLIVRDFLAVVGRRPNDAEYGALRGLVNACHEGQKDEMVRLREDVREATPAAIWERPRDILGRAFDPEQETYEGCICKLYDAMMQQFVTLNRVAVERRLDLLVFPEGTRSVRLAQGRIGALQMAMHLGLTIVPVGCNGSDRVYPGSSPLAKGGTVTYRVGEPVTPADLAKYTPKKTFVPFSATASRHHGPAFQAATDLVMARINELLDPRHQYDPDAQAEKSTSRFI